MAGVFGHAAALELEAASTGTERVAAERDGGDVGGGVEDRFWLGLGGGLHFGLRGSGHGFVFEDQARGPEAYARRRVRVGEQFANCVDCVLGECGKICHHDFSLQGVFEKWGM